jgi:AraC-like DNA-binding protein
MTKTPPIIYQHASFLDKNPAAWGLMQLFDYLPGVIFYAKDRQSRYVAANRAMLAAKNLKDPARLLGRTDADFHPGALAEAYMAEDRKVMEKSHALPNEIWFVLDRRGRPGWFNSSKLPLLDAQGLVAGLAGVRYAIETPKDRDRQFQALAPVIRFLEEHYTEVVSMKQMCELAGMSSTHFNRRFGELFRMSPTRFLHSLRIDKARQLLAHTSLSIGDIAMETGYHDQSHFTRHFRQLTGMTPRTCRRK